MLSHDAPHKVHRIQCESGFRYVIYNASEIGNPSDHVPDKWYFSPYPVPVGLQAGEPFDSFEQAEMAARAQNGGVRHPDPAPRIVDYVHVPS